MPEIMPVQQGTSATLPYLFCVPPGNDTAGFHRLAHELGPEWTLWLVEPDPELLRPENPFGPEATSSRIVDLVRSNHSPGKPFVLVGFCLGGILTWNAAGTLKQDGCLGLVLVDTPMPGHPHPYPGLRYPLDVVRYLRDRRAAAGTPATREPLKLMVKRKVAWHMMTRARPLLRRHWLHPSVQRLAEKTRPFEMRQFIRIRRLSLPVLHFLGDNETDFNMRVARLAWPRFLRAPYTTRVLSGDHKQVFFRPNVPRLAEGIREWVATLG